MIFTHNKFVLKCWIISDWHCRLWWLGALNTSFIGPGPRPLGAYKTGFNLFMFYLCLDSFVALHEALCSKSSFSNPADINRFQRQNSFFFQLHQTNLNISTIKMVLIFGFMAIVNVLIFHMLSKVISKMLLIFHCFELHWGLLFFTKN